MASTIEACGGLAVIAGASSVAVPVVLIAYEHTQAKDRLDKWLSGPPGPIEKRRARRRRVRPELLGIGLAYAIQSRNHQTYAQKLLGIRRVGVGGQSVTIRNAVVRYVISRLINESASRAMYRSADKRWERLATLKPELAKLSRDHDDDWIKLLRALLKLSREHDADPFTPLVVETAGKLSAHVLCVLVSPRRQGLADLVAGIITVADTDNDDH